jgi:phosphoenolpyruvate carboxykinase (ATP)
MESSAGDPTKAGTTRSVFFYDPFMVGDKVEHANRFYEISNNLPNLNFYLINTGEIGEGEELKGEIGVDRTMAILDSLFRGGLDVWVDSPTGLKVPGAIRLVDDIFLHPEKLFRKEKFTKKIEGFYQVVEEAITKLGESLHPKVRDAFKKQKRK